MRGTARRVAAACAVSLIAGCSLFVSLDGLGGGSNGGTEGDGSIAPDGSPVDGSPQNDGGPPNDGSVAPFDAAVSPCRVAHTFCDDFDNSGESAGSLPFWSFVAQSPPGSITLTSDFFETPPMALAALYAPDAQAYAGEALQSTTAGAFAKAHCEMDVRIEALDVASNQVIPIYVTLSATGSIIGVEWTAWNGTNQNLHIQEDPNDGGFGIGNDSPHTESLMLHRWYHVAIDIDGTPADAGLPTFALALDGTPTMEVAFPDRPMNLNNFAFEVGLIAIQPVAQPDRFLFDNVFCDVQ